MNIIAILTACLGSLLLICSSIAFLRAKDIFVAIQPLKAINFYALPLILTSFLLKNFSIPLLAKTAIIIFTTIIITNLLIHTILRHAKEIGVTPDAETKNLIKKPKKRKSPKKTPKSQTK